MNDLTLITAERERLWFLHPIITESAVLPTKAVQAAVKRTLELARKARASIAHWADPLTGKSSCLRAIAGRVRKEVIGCGVLMFEAVEDEQPAEGRLLAMILKATRYAPRVAPALAEKRDQVHRALLALSGEAKHLFLLIDEAQELSNKEFAWMKAVINGLSREGVKVTTVLFGQRELKKRREDLYAEGRSDLGDRFMKRLHEFKGIRSEADILALLTAMDEKSEFPPGSGWSYTQLLFPRAHAAGFRFASFAKEVWECLRTSISPKILSKGLAMDMISAVIAGLCIALKDRDADDMVVTTATVKTVVNRALAE